MTEQPSRPANVVERRMGRPTSLTPAAHDAIMRVVSSGIPWKYSAQAAGVSYATVWAWRRRGLVESDRIDAAVEVGDVEGQIPFESEAIYLKFYEDLMNARDAAITRNLLNIQQAARGGYVTEKTVRKLRDGSTEETEKRTAPDWRAASRALSFADPETFSENRNRVEVTGADGGAVQVTSVATPEGLAVSLAERFAALAGRTSSSEDVVDGEVVED